MANSKPQFETTDNGLLVRAPAKVNLSLLIAGKRADGFHEIETIMAKVNLFDELYLEKTDQSYIDFVCTGKYAIPADNNNLVIKACNVLNITRNLKIKLVKNIPAGAGLAGGSSDAAATLLGLNRLFNLKLSDTELSNLAANLGSDVAFFLGKPLAFCSGRGEKITKIDKIFEFSALLFIPNITSSTKRVYENYSHNNTLYLSLKSKISEFLLNKNIDLVAKMCANMLEYSCFSIDSRLADLKSKINSLGLGNACLSGSGSCIFVIIDKSIGLDMQKIRRAIVGDIDCDIVLVSNSDW